MTSPASKRRVSMRDVARVAGISVSAVSLIAAGRPGVSEETRARTIAVMRQLGYVPRQRAQPDDERYTLAIVSERLMHPIDGDIFYAEIVQGIQVEAQRHGHRVLLHLVDRGEMGVEPLLDRVHGEIDGMILTYGGDLTDDMIGHLVKSQVPVVVVDNYAVDQPLHCVVVDNVTAGYLATRHLLRLGHRRIGLLGALRTYRNLVDRQQGYFDALMEYGVRIEQALMPALPPHVGGQKGYQQMLGLLALPDPPTAVVAISDKTAFGAMEALKERGLRIPGDMALVGIDDVDESAHTTPALTTVHVPWAQMGAEALRRLVARLHCEAPRPTKTVLYTYLIVRESCGGSVP